MSLARRARWAVDRRRLNGLRVARAAERAGERVLAEAMPRISRGAPDTWLALGDDVYLYPAVGFFLDAPGATIEVGDRTYVNRRTELVAQTSVRIGDDCLISWDVLITDTDYHRVDDRPTTEPVVVGDRVWLGARAAVLKGVTIGEGAIVAAGALVIGDVEPRTLVGGVPARVLRRGVDWS